MPPLMSCSVQFSVAVFFQNTSEINSLLFLAEVVQLPLEVSSYHVLLLLESRSCCTWTVRCSMRESDNEQKFSYSKKYVGLQLSQKMLPLYGLTAKNSAPWLGGLATA